MGGKNTLLPKCFYVYLSSPRSETGIHTILAKKSAYCEKASKTSSAKLPKMQTSEKIKSWMFRLPCNSHK